MNKILDLRMPCVFVTLLYVSVNALGTSSANAQGPWGLTMKTGINLPTAALGVADLHPGIGMEGVVTFQMTTFLLAYTGWGWDQFTANQSFAGTNVAFEETGYTFGLQFNYPTSTSKVTYVVGLGGIYNHLEAEDNTGTFIAGTHHRLGSQVDVGISVTLGRRVQCTPYGRYRSLSTEFEIDTTTTRVDLKYLSVGAGIAYMF